MSDDEREQVCTAASVPLSMSAQIQGNEWARDTIGEAGAAIYRLRGKNGAPDLFLKHGKDEIADDVTEEMARLCWLAE